MTINTTTGALKLTKTELKLLANSKALLVKLAKHGDGGLSESAEVAMEAIGDVERDLNKVEEQKAA